MEVKKQQEGERVKESLLALGSSPLSMESIPACSILGWEKGKIIMGLNLIWNLAFLSAFENRGYTCRLL